MTPMSPLVLRTAPPPVMEARRWLAGVDFPDRRPLINLSQAAPVEPPPERLREAMAEMVRSEPDTHVYGPVLGNPALRSEIAWRWSALYGGDIEPDEVAVTAGANQAFCTAIATIAAPGDAVMLPVPWYFNHKMWLDIAGLETVPLPCGDGMLPDVEAARALMTPRVKAIVLVTPNNPTGAEYPPDLVAAFAALARENSAMLVLDETYRDFLSRDGRPHDLFADPSWRDWLVHLYSFSKAFRLTGHRTGALVASPRAPCPGREGARHRHHLPAAARPEGRALGPAQPHRLARRRARRDPRPPRRRPRRRRRPPGLARPRLRRLLPLRRAPAPARPRTSSPPSSSATSRS